MCIIILNKKDSVLSDDVLKNSFENNPDGAGFAYVDKNNALKVVKGIFELKQFLETYKQIKAESSGDVVIHCRISTGGKIDKNNCHPHVIHDDLVLFHNGILNNVTPTKTESDTKIFIKKFLDCFDTNNLLFNKELLNLIEYSIGGGNKFVLFSNKGMVILNEKAGHRDEAGNWYSNDSYKQQKILSFFNYNNNYYTDADIYYYIDELTADDFQTIGKNPYLDLITYQLYKRNSFPEDMILLKLYDDEIYRYYIEAYNVAMTEYNAWMDEYLSNT